MRTETIQRDPAQFPKLCTGCRKEQLTEEAWSRLPPAAGGLVAMGMEWRNHSCGSTIVVRLKEGANG